MQSQIAGWEQSEQVLCPLLASSPPPAAAPDFLQPAYKFLSATPTAAVFNPFTSITAATTPQKLFVESFSTPIASQASVFDALDQQQQSYVSSLLQSTISSNNSQTQPQLVGTAAQQTNTNNLTEYLKNIAALNVTSASTTVANDLNKVLAALQPSTPTTTQLLSANNESIAQSALIASGQDSIQTRTLLETSVVGAHDPASTIGSNPFAQQTSQQQLASLLSAGQSAHSQQQSSSIQSNTLSDLKSLLSNSLLQPQQQTADLQPNPFLAPANQTQQTTAGAFSFVSSPQQSTVAKPGFSLYSPQLTEALKMLRSPIRELPPATKKPIPLNSPIDLASFRVKDPYKWTSDDVVAWVLGL
jgi:hypothetical protein